MDFTWDHLERFLTQHPKVTIMTMGKGLMLIDGVIAKEDLEAFTTNTVPTTPKKAGK